MLGTVCHPKEDKFTFKIKLKLSKEQTPSGDPGILIPLKLTKRLILSKLVSIFDSIGVGAAVLVKPMEFLKIVRRFVPQLTWQPESSVV